ncbi:hypothetical protein PCC7424_3515 [Gloeothece citriformis PCC 7424]|uniref:Uncharacterized protein n=1 Tax=Gloeothece citriformis (strain PCC 7424) TaxID=65393 RepID=B7KGI0_GLOC7|nr:hypothetical protein [Gloeothece citriformis]ACK71907.1 hypothetical protein PCC7424_3515 [Gloeothece citriformis PCC 7424]
MLIVNLEFLESPEQKELTGKIKGTGVQATLNDLKISEAFTPAGDLVSRSLLINSAFAQGIQNADIVFQSSTESGIGFSQGSSILSMTATTPGNI